MYTVIVFFIGLILTAVYEWRKSLLTPVFVHAGCNMLFVAGVFATMIVNANSPLLGVAMQESSTAAWSPRSCLNPQPKKPVSAKAT